MIADVAAVAFLVASALMFFAFSFLFFRGEGSG
jgi:hypothetical protein